MYLILLMTTSWLELPYPNKCRLSITINATSLKTFLLFHLRVNTCQASAVVTITSEWAHTCESLLRSSKVLSTFFLLDTLVKIAVFLRAITLSQTISTTFLFWSKVWLIASTASDNLPEPYEVPRKHITLWDVKSRVSLFLDLIQVIYPKLRSNCI